MPHAVMFNYIVFQHNFQQLLPLQDLFHEVVYVYANFNKSPVIAVFTMG